MSTDQARDWSPQTEEVLRRAGWRPGRFVPTDTWESILRERGSFVAHEAARRFLSEFGGLVTYGWPADSIATSSAIRFDPLGAQWQDERFARASREAGESLYPIGMADEGASFLGITENGALHLLRDRVEPLATSTDQALDRLVAAQAARSALWTPGAPAAGHSFWTRLDTVETGTDAGQRWPLETDRVLRAGGWFPGRAVPTETWESILLQTGEFGIHGAARRFLAEFGAVGVPYRKPRGSMPWTQFSLDPLPAIWDGEIIDDLAEQAGVDLYPIGMRDRGNQHLAMAEDGSLYAGMDSVWLLAPTLDEALQRLTGV
ncbi:MULTISPECIES: SUKH-3 domain-containing protein [Streptomyces]|uniref:SUKH-3 domain-containing protein n=1 Tax=Streptomyces koelreuteriae TaxID=2838015 RepID=A0ABX8FR65_9ACTN|nr:MULTISPECIES: SUKH-3 domain-containing protein [Streptomyces]QWB23665.1 SUKH-3 domain-containing protein [Streptomyces koelreuteriae]UUA06631.1 SUKH-3 domain-containing protein [Streptomyces koelreuteriae]UUA14259.1 SUKH-3 domain-containing protein [Streptomyces sp. CRCS-T-1]